MTNVGHKRPNRTLAFDCPQCGGYPAVAGERDVYVHAGVIHHCAVCGGEVVFQALTVERCLETVTGAVDCCCLADRCGYGPSTPADIGPGVGGGR